MTADRTTSDGLPVRTDCRIPPGSLIVTSPDDAPDDSGHTCAADSPCDARQRDPYVHAHREGRETGHEGHAYDEFVARRTAELLLSDDLRIDPDRRVSLTVARPHEHDWTYHQPATCGGTPVWTCSGCPLWRTSNPSPQGPTIVEGPSGGERP